MNYPEEDRRAARAVHDAITKLNLALATAQEVGLHVEIDYTTRDRFDRRWPSRIYTAQVERHEIVNLSDPNQ